MTFESIALFLWGLWLFMLWIIFFDEATKKMVSWWIKHIIKKATNSLFKTIWIWFFATIILQWSSAVLLILESFVSAGMMEFTHAARVIMWANIWSSAIGVILWSLWLEFDLAAYALPLLWALAFALLIIKSDKAKNILKIVIWLCLIFVWLWYMNDWMAFVANAVDFVKLSSCSIALFYFVWLFGTMIMQSSAITIALTLSAASVWIVDYRMWIMMLLWCFLGTTSTPVLWCIKWWYLKKQVAATQVIFNAVLSVFGIALLPVFVWLMNKITSDVVLGLSIFTLLFKIVWVALMLPFLDKFISLIQKRFPKKNPNFGLNIEWVSPTVIPAWLHALEQDLLFVLKKVLKHALNTWNTREKDLNTKNYNVKHSLEYEKLYPKDDLRAQYDDIKEISQHLFIFLAQLKSNATDEKDIKKIDDYQHSLACMLRCVKYMKDVHKTIEKLKDSDDKSLIYIYDEFKVIIIRLYKDIQAIKDEKTWEERSARIRPLVKSIKTVVDKDFLDSFANNPSIEKFDSTILSDILYVSHNFYEACFYIVLALNALYDIDPLDVIMWEK